MVADAEDTGGGSVRRFGGGEFGERADRFEQGAGFGGRPADDGDETGARRGVRLGPALDSGKAFPGGPAVGAEETDEGGVAGQGGGADFAPGGVQGERGGAVALLDGEGGGPGAAAAGAGAIMLRQRLLTATVRRALTRVTAARRARPAMA